LLALTAAPALAQDAARDIAQAGDVFGVHGIGGDTGTLLVGVFAAPAIGGAAGLLLGMANRC